MRKTSSFPSMMTRRSLLCMSATCNPVVTRSSLKPTPPKPWNVLKRCSPWPLRSTSWCPARTAGRWCANWSKMKLPATFQCWSARSSKKRRKASVWGPQIIWSSPSFRMTSSARSTVSKVTANCTTSWSWMTIRQTCAWRKRCSKMPATSP